MSKPSESPSLRSLFASVGCVWLGSWGLLALCMGTPGDRGTFGDSFGAVNALFSGLALAGLVHAIGLQRKEVALQRQEIENQLEELAATREVSQRHLEETQRANALRIQPFLSLRVGPVRASRVFSPAEPTGLRLEGQMQMELTPLTADPAANVAVDVVILDGVTGARLAQLAYRLPVVARSLADTQGYVRPLPLDAAMLAAILPAVAGGGPILLASRVTLRNLLGGQFHCVELRRAEGTRPEQSASARTLAEPPGPAPCDLAQRTLRATGDARNPWLAELRKVLSAEAAVVVSWADESLDFETGPVVGNVVPAAELASQEPVRTWIEAALVDR